jgi:hypothetical protein
MLIGSSIPMDDDPENLPEQQQAPQQLVNPNRRITSSPSSS